MTKSERILVTGGTGLIGTNLRERLERDGYDVVAIGSEYDLRDPRAAAQAFERYDPSVVFHLAARVGGIYANTRYKADFYSDNVLINTNVVNAAVSRDLGYMFAMGTGCAYPKRLEGALLREADFLDGEPEPTNDAYAYAKRGLLVHLEALQEEGALESCYCIPANIYGPNDNYHPTHSHVVPGLIRRFVEAADEGADHVTIWGDGSASRDFLYIDDCVDAMLRLAEANFSGRVNVATGEQSTINRLAEVVRSAAGLEGAIQHDLSYPSGQRERLFDTSTVRSRGWRPRHSLEEGIEKTVQWFRTQTAGVRER